MVGLSYALRCVAFHGISSTPTPFTAGIKVDTTPQQLEKTLRYLTAHYHPVSLQEVLTGCDGRGLPPRALLVTFDDAYASVAEIAGPLCQRFKVPAVFFVNAAFLNNCRLAPDNLICYVAAVHDLALINKAAQAAFDRSLPTINSLSELFTVLLPSLSLEERETFLEAIRKSAGIDEKKLAQESALYMTTEQLRSLAAYDIEIGNHTYTHAHGRCLTPDGMVAEIDQNKDTLERLSGRKVRCFSVPYGSSKDLNPRLVEHLEQTGHEAAFLSESVANSSLTGRFSLDRISSHARSDAGLFFEIELMPRLRAIRNRCFRSSAAAPRGDFAQKAISR